VCASHGVHFSRELHLSERLGALPLSRRIAGAKLAFEEHGFAVAEKRDLEESREIESNRRV
jgi:hypothetical protein